MAKVKCGWIILRGNRGRKIRETAKGTENTEEENFITRENHSRWGFSLVLKALRLPI